MFDRLPTSVSLSFWKKSRTMSIILPGLFLAGLFLGMGPCEFALKWTSMFSSRPTRKLPPEIERQEVSVESPVDIEAMEKYVLRYPKSTISPRYLVALTRKSLERKELGSCLKWLDFAQKNRTGPALDFLTFEIGRSMGDAGYLEEGEKILETLLKASVWTRPEALKELGNIAQRQGKAEIAYRHWTSLKRRYPYSKSFREVEGPLALLTCRTVDSPRQDDRIKAALYLSRRQRYEEALQLLDEGANDTQAYYRIKVLNQAGEYSQAIQAARSFLERYPQSEWRPSVQTNLKYNLRRKKTKE